jgi:hypothetical protein
MTRTFWQEMNVPMRLVKQKYTEFFGTEKRTIDSREEAVSFLSPITGKIQEKLVSRMKTENVNSVIKDLYKILDECFRFYMRQKEARHKMVEQRVSSSEIVDTFGTNRNIAMYVISSVNLWIENCLLFQESLYKPYDDKSFEVNNELFIELYIYGLASRALSLLNMSKKFGEDALYYGIQISPDKSEPLEILKYHPVLYFNTLLTGNQDQFEVSIEEFQQASSSKFGIGFEAVYGLDFLLALRTFSTLQSALLMDGKYPYVVFDKEYLVKWIRANTDGLVDGNCFLGAFALSEANVRSQLKNNEPIIWRMGSNQYRHEIRPLLYMNNGRVVVSYTALEQAKHLWLSYFSNGGMIYSNAQDDLTAAVEQRNEELSKRLVEMLREKLRSHYVAGFDEIDVDYSRIFGKRSCNYGDYDLVFYAKEEKELFLIEAKFFSDSLNNSGMISDYEKLFKKNGYYDHCRKRYDLVLAEPEKMKAFIGVDESVSLHCLFVSSKPLEIEFQDEDGVVSFPCLSIFNDYLEGRLLPEVGDTPMRPTHQI